MRAFFIISIAACVALTSFSSAASDSEPKLLNLETLQGFTSSGASSSPKDVASNIRYGAMKDAAFSIGARGGLAWRTEQINEKLKSLQDSLDTVFDFNRMLFRKNVLYPVLVRAQNTYRRDSDDLIRVSDHIYKIESQAKFVSRPPIWQDYLITHYSSPDQPHSALLPKSGDEIAVWKAQVAEGWEDGIKQADTIFEEHLNQLVRDYDGMILYRVLLSYKMVSEPFIAESRLGVTGDGASMNVNDTVYKITVKPTLDTNSAHWKSIILP